MPTNTATSTLSTTTATAALPRKLFPMVVTDDLAAVRAFYVDRLGFIVVHDMEGYLGLRWGEDEQGPEIAFMVSAGGQMLGTSLAPHRGRGVVISIPTADADRLYAGFQKRGVEAVGEPVDRPWGWRSFLVRDCCDVILDFFHPTPQSASADASS